MASILILRIHQLRRGCHRLCTLASSTVQPRTYEIERNPERLGAIRVDVGDRGGALAPRVAHARIAYTFQLFPTAAHAVDLAARQATPPARAPANHTPIALAGFPMNAWQGDDPFRIHPVAIVEAARAAAAIAVGLCMRAGG